MLDEMRLVRHMEDSQGRLTLHLTCPIEKLFANSARIPTCDPSPCVHVFLIHQGTFSLYIGVDVYVRTKVQMVKNILKARELVFVYGTVKRGEPNAHVMGDSTSGICRFIGCARTLTAFPLIIASRYNIPFCLEKPGEGHFICGEVYAVDEQKLKAVDELEGHPYFYRRRRQMVTMECGRIETAWIYLLPKWTPKMLRDATEYLENYSSKGPHGRPYNTSENCNGLDDLC